MFHPHFSFVAPIVKSLKFNETPKAIQATDKIKDEHEMNSDSKVEKKFVLLVHYMRKPTKSAHMRSQKNQAFWNLGKGPERRRERG